MQKTKIYKKISCFVNEARLNGNGRLIVGSKILSSFDSAFSEILDFSGIGYEHVNGLIVMRNVTKMKTVIKIK